jgi:hypothetical protein
MGRFISRDPIEENGGINLYAYTSNAPDLYVDPEGTQPWMTELQQAGMTIEEFVQPYLDKVPGEMQEFEELVQAEQEKIEELILQAEQKFPGKCGLPCESHHIIPQYLGGPFKAPAVRLPAPLHQAITNAFENAWGRTMARSGSLPNLQQLKDMLDKIYSQFPIKGFPSGCHPAPKM